MLISLLYNVSALKITDLTSRQRGHLIIKNRKYFKTISVEEKG
jgi:hypothetical protein